MIEVKNLHKYYNKGRQNELHVIDGITLSLPKCGIVALFGKSGCGKTTLLNLLGGLDGAHSGTVVLAGESVSVTADEIRNKHVGYIFQNYNLVQNETCAENIADALYLCGMTDKVEIDKRITSALSAVGLEKYRNRFPDTLSGGQQQRIAIARAIVKNPAVILADEPTGNLDEANTVMIMNLLRRIASDRLVILVTHEENLVDHYADTVIELSDGKVVGERHNESTGGYAVRDKNTVYLGELPQSTVAGNGVSLECYGEMPDEPVRLRLVHYGGKLYLKAESEGVAFLDRDSEVKLSEGAFEGGEEAESVEHLDLSPLPATEKSRYGKLFSFRSALKSGYRENFKHKKRGNRALIACMALFAAVLVVMTSLFGTAFRDLRHVRETYNHNVFYVYTASAADSLSLNQAVNDPQSGIDAVYLYPDIPYGDDTVNFMTGFFETFRPLHYDDGFRTNAVLLDASLVAKLPLVEGKKDGLAFEEIVITTCVADALLETSDLGYITEYKDLIGLVTDVLTVDGKHLRITGIVESDESAIYLDELALAKYTMSRRSVYLFYAPDYGVTVSDGEAVLAVRYKNASTSYPKAGDTVKLEGRDVKIASVEFYYDSYEQYVQAIGEGKKPAEVYFSEQLLANDPTLDEMSDEFYDLLKKAVDERYGEWAEYYYSELDSFIEMKALFDRGEFEIWLIREKGIEEIKYTYGYAEDYYRARLYKEKYGRYPSKSELARDTELPYLDEVLKRCYELYEREHMNLGYTPSLYDASAFLLGEGDYIAASKQMGETHPLGKPFSEGSDKDYIFPYYSASKEDVMVDFIYTGEILYTKIHSTDPVLTAAYLEKHFSHVDSGVEYMPSILTPDGIYEATMEEYRNEIIASLVALFVLLLIMSTCMYFIMRSSLLRRIKEVGIYRAIGVSKKNLIFRFFTEALVLTTLTVFVSYLIMSILMYRAYASSPLAEGMIYYPIPLALALLAVIYAVCLFLGTLPILTLLRKTPSEILAKYDI